MVRIIIVLWFCLITLNLPLPVKANTFCVNTSAALHNALIAAQSNNQDDQIRVMPGVYKRSGGPFTYSSSQTNALELLGGWSSCGIRQVSRSPTATRFSGDEIHPALKVVSNGDVIIEQVALSHGFSNLGAGLQLSSASGGSLGDVLLERVIFHNNTATSSASALLHSGGQTITIRNSLFVANTGHSTIRFENDGDGLYFINNTVADNISGGGSGLAANFVLFNDAEIVIANSIFWRNEGADLRVDVNHSLDALIRNNIIDGYQGPPLSVLNINADPRFGNLPFIPNGYRPKSLSPQVEAGAPTLPPPPPIPLPFQFSWSVGPRDFDGFHRIQGSRVDLGAHEFPLLFRDSFE